MSKVLFIFEDKPLEVQYNKNDSMKNICQKFADKINKDINKLIFLYDGNEINFQLKIYEQAKEFERKEGKMNILVYSKLEDNNKKKKMKDKDIICPKCGEICLLNIEN